MQIRASGDIINNINNGTLTFFLNKMNSSMIMLQLAPTHNVLILRNKSVTFAFRIETITFQSSQTPETYERQMREPFTFLI